MGKLLLCIIFFLPSVTRPTKYKIFQRDSKSLSQRVKEIEKEIGLQEEPLEFEIVETDSTKILYIHPYLTDLDSIVFITEGIASFKDTTTVWSYESGVW